MNSLDLIKLYKKTAEDELVTPFKDDYVGFSVVREYKKNTTYFKEDKRIFIKIYLVNNQLHGSVSMVNSNNGETDNYLITDISKYKGKITNFEFNDTENFIFNDKKRKILYKPKEKFYTLNQIIDILVDNHLHDRLFLQRVIHFLTDKLIKCLFLLNDQKYDPVKAMMQIHNSSLSQGIETTEKKKTEPFFNYFYISRNTLFAFLFLSLVLSLISPLKNIFGESNVSNPKIVFLFFIMLFVSEKVSVFLDQAILSFYKNQENFIYKLHNYNIFGPFKFKIKIPKNLK